MTAISEQGRQAALEALRLRRALFAGMALPRNEDQPAGSPMYFRCIGCGKAIVVAEDYVSKPDKCDECAALVALGWME